MARGSPIRSGGSTPGRSSGSARSRRSSSGTRTCPSSPCCSTRPPRPATCWRRRDAENAMQSLRDVERDFARALLGEADGAVVASILGDGLSPAARLGVYRNHVFSTLTDALEATYPVVCRLVDPRFFAYAVDRYIRACPPAGPCLFEYGESLPEFLAAFPPCRHLQYLPDVARLEWAINRALHAEDAEPLDPTRLRGLSPEGAARLALRLHPSASFLESRWPVDRVWRANQPGADPDGIVDLDAGGVRLEVRRPGGPGGFRSLAAARSPLRPALAAGGGPGRAVEAARAG